MNVHRPNRNWQHPGLVVIVVVVAVLTKLFLATTIVVMAFQSPLVSVSTNSYAGHHQSIFPLYTSLSVPPDYRPSDFDEDTNTNTNNGGQHHEITIEKFERHPHHQDNDDEQIDHLTETALDATATERKRKTTTSPDQSHPRFDPFLAYLNGMTGSIHNPNVLANRLDDELKRMETRVFELIGDDIPLVRYPLGLENRGYNKKPRRPTLEVYELVAWAYAKSSLRTVGAELAENVLQRFQKHNPQEQPSMKLLASIMKAWIKAKNLNKTEYWLNQIEEQFRVNVGNENHDKTILVLPGYPVYHPLIVGLQNMKQNKKTANRIADLSMKAIETMRTNLEVSNDDAVARYLPSNITYLAAMNNVKNSTYDGRKQFDLLETLWRYHHEDYQKYGRIRSKAGANHAANVFVAAGQCIFPQDLVVVKRCEEILQQLQEEYQKTADVDFRPIPTMYERMIYLYARSNRRKNPQLFADRTLTLLRSMKQVGVDFKESYVATAALNRVMQTAENCIPAKPLQDPVRTRELFGICLTAFKHFHHSNNNNDLGDTLATPNENTYQIFLRACSHLPQGEVRSKLSAKAFRLCQHNGLVSKGVCKELYSSNPALATMEFGTTITTAKEFAMGTIEIPVKGNLHQDDKSHKNGLEIVSMGFHKSDDDSSGNHL